MGLVVSLSTANSVYDRCAEKLAKLWSDMSSEHKRLSVVVFFSKLEDIINKELVTPFLNAECQSVATNQHQEERVIQFVNSVCRQLKKAVEKLATKYSHNAGRHLVQSLVLFFEYQKQFPNHVERDFELSKKRISRFVFQDDDDDDGDSLDVDNEPAQHSSGGGCRYVKHMSASFDDIVRYFIDYRIKSMLELLASPDILLEWKESCVKHFYTIQFDKQYDILMHALAKAKQEAVTGVGGFSLTPPSSQRFNNVKNLAPLTSIRKIMFEASPPQGLGDHFVGVPLEYVKHPTMKICDCSSCIASSSKSSSTLQKVQQQLVTFFDTKQTALPIFSRSQTMLLAFVKPISWRNASLKWLDANWTAIPNETPGWENLFHAKLEKKAKDTRLLNSSQSKTIQGVSFVPLKSTGLGNKRVFALDEIHDTHAPTTASVSDMLSQRPKNFDQMNFWADGEDLKQSVLENANNVRCTIDKTCFVR